MVRFAIILLTVTLLPSVSRGQYVCYHQGNNGTNTIAIPQGETWQLVSYAAYTPDPGNNSITILSTTNTNSYVAWNLPSLYYDYGNIISAKQTAPGFILPGPAYIFLRSNWPNYHFVFKKLGQESTRPASSTSVVIPSSREGDVEIKVEQSADQLTWTECLPGAYSSSTLKRFFRLRAIEK